MAALLLVYQVASAIAGQGLGDVRFDLAAIKPPAATDDTIVVTGRRRGLGLRMTMTESQKEPLLPKAEIGILGNVRASTEVEQSALANGAISNRVMVKVKVPF
jgi:hypothetical protein